MARKGFPAPPASARDTYEAPSETLRLPWQPRQRRRGVLALGVLTVVLGGLLTYEAVIQLSGRNSVIVTSRDVPIGQTITSADVTIVQVGADAGVAMIPGREVNHVVGSIAAVDLRRGTLVARADLTTQLVPGAGQQLVPIAVKPSRLPARGLQPGDQVLVIPAPDGTAVSATGGKATSSPQSAGRISATVDRLSSSPDTDGLLVVDLLASVADGPQLAQEASDGHVVLVLTSRRP
jgi:hypothetical protein